MTIQEKEGTIEVTRSQGTQKRKISLKLERDTFIIGHGGKEAQRGIEAAKILNVVRRKEGVEI